ncbi:MAG: efflux RND transporter periplasmic adaptor subunit [Desulfovibrionaceae bacterium]
MRRSHKMDAMLRLGPVLALLLAGILTAGCGDTAKGPQAAATPEVSVVTIVPRSVTLSTQLSGRTSAFRIAEIRPRVSGLILKRLFTEGSNVTAGQVLYQIDPAPFQAELANAQADLGQAVAQLKSIGSKAKRYKELLGAKTVSQQDYDDASAALNELRASIAALQAKVDVARINLGYTRITAPIPGRIGKSSVTDGAIVTAYQSTPLSTIQQLDPIYVDVPQSTTDLLRIRARIAKGGVEHNAQGQNVVRLILENGAPYPLEGVLQFSDVTVDQTTGSVTLRAVFPNPDGLLLPGMFVVAVVNEGVEEQGILVPQQAVQRDHQGNPYALTVDAENKVQRRDLVLDRAMGDQWLVASGLDGGERVVMEGVQLIRPGSTVKVTSVAAEPAPAGSAPVPAESPAPAAQPAAPAGSAPAGSAPAPAPAAAPAPKTPPEAGAR